MPGKNEDFLQATIKQLQLKRWELMAATITDRISILIRIPAATLTKTLTPAEQALSNARQLAPQGWRLTGFNFDGNHLLIDAAHDLLE